MSSFRGGWGLLAAALAWSGAGFTTVAGRSFPEAVRSSSEWRVESTVPTAADLTTAIDVHVHLQMRNFAGLEERIHAGEVIPAAEMEASYLPDKADYDRLTAWLQGQGLQVLLVDRNHTTAYVRGSAAALSRVFGVRFAWVAKGGERWISAVTAPSLPDSIAADVLSISGLQPERGLRRLGANGLQAQLLHSASNGQTYILPQDVSAAYDFPSNLDGTGQTVGIVEDAVAATSEISAFTTVAGLPAISNVTVVRPDQISLQNQSIDDPEAALDVEWIGSLSPGAALRVYADNDLLVAIGAMVNDLPAYPSMRVLSISYGAQESESFDAGYLQTMAQLAASGVSVLVASGDDDSTEGTSAVEYPASDVNVTAVGGTAMEFTSAGIYDGEGTFSADDGDGGEVTSVWGPSTLYSLPAWQVSAVQSINGGQYRWVPDVAGMAMGYDPALGTIYPFIYDENGQDVGVGTSVAAPIWASVVAIINQERSKAGSGEVGFLNPLIYPFASGTVNMTPPLSLNGVTAFQKVTGLGCPDVTQLVLCLGDQFYAYTGSANLGIQSGGAIILSATVVGSASQYQWQVNTGSGWVNVADGADATIGATFLGAQTGALTIEAGSSYATGLSYRAVVTGANGSVALTGATAVWLGQITAKVTQGVPSQPIAPGNSVAMTATASLPQGSTDTLVYQWELNGEPLAGQTSSYCSFEVTTASEGEYSVMISDAAKPGWSVALSAGDLSVVLPQRIFHPSVLAGNEAPGYQDGAGTSAEFNGASGLAVDGQGNVYVADSGNGVIWKVAPDGTTSTVVPATAGLGRPWTLARDSTGDLFIGDNVANQIHELTAAGDLTDWPGAVSTSPSAMALGPDGSLYASNVYQAVERIAPNGATSVFTGTKASVLATNPDGSIFEATGDDLITVSASGTETALPLTFAPFLQGEGIGGIARDGSGRIFVSVGGDDIYQVYSSGLVSEAVNEEGGSIVIGLNPTTSDGLVADAAGDLYWSDSGAVYVATPVATITQATPVNAVAAGSSVTLGISVDASEAASSFQWSHQGVPIAGATSATFTLPLAAVSDDGEYTVKWTNSLGSVTLTAGVLNVTASDAKLTNLSARADVAVGGNDLTSGVVISGDSSSNPKNLLITGKGPFLSPFGISNYLAQPTETLFDSSSLPIVTEGAWDTAPAPASGSGASPLAQSLSVGSVSSALSQSITGFPLSASSPDALMTAALPAGSYTNIVSGANGGTGVALTEIFDIDYALGNASNTARLANLSARAVVAGGDQTLIAGFIVDGGPSGGPETLLLRAQGPNLLNFGVLNALPGVRLTVYDSSSRPIASNYGWSSGPLLATGSTASPLASAGASIEPAPAALQQQYAGYALGTGSLDSAVVVTLPPGSYSVILDSPSGATGVGLVELFELR